MRVCVYSICKNESNFARRWFDSVKEADYICVLDTGSTDNTCETLFSLMREKQIIVSHRNYNNFQFNVARNESLGYTPTDADICLVLDFDEYLDPGWRAKLEEGWQLGSNKAVLTLEEDGECRELRNRVHSNRILDGWYWNGAVNEVLESTKISGDEIKECYLSNIVVHHTPDKNKDRSYYDKLIDNNLSRRDYYNLAYSCYCEEKYSECLSNINSLLSLQIDGSLPYMVDIAALYIMYGRSNFELNNYEEAANGFIKAMRTLYYFRDTYAELADILNKVGDGSTSIKLIDFALSMSKQSDKSGYTAISDEELIKRRSLYEDKESNSEFLRILSSKKHLKDIF